ncbi:YaaL family protein [Bacillus sp. FSL K6-3431]|uniref:YaaL family protein n=1 Tax=Bacillus sp. FSL K6-3431 TaxID=2921500 RepID=UPI0030F52432
MFRKQKLRKAYDQKLIDVMESTRENWLHQRHLENLSYEQSEDIRCRTLLAQAKYFFLFREAKIRKISTKK